MTSIDLHVHSTASDGTVAPASLVRMANEKGLGALALTDHDTVSGIEEFLSEAKALDLPAIPGVELSVAVESENSIHIVGLFIDHKNNQLCDLLCEIRKNRDSRNILIVEKLRGMKFNITLEELEAEAKGESVGRPHIAKILIRKGYFEHPQEVFDKCLKKGAPAYCPRILPDPKTAIDTIHAANGFAIWAHPMHRADTSPSYIEKTLCEFIKLGLDGVEAYYSTFTRDQQNLMLDFAKKYNLLVSGGSDYHGDNMRDIELGTGYGGLSVPLSVYENLVQKYHEKHKSLPK